MKEQLQRFYIKYAMASLILQAITEDASIGSGRLQIKLTFRWKFKKGKHFQQIQKWTKCLASFGGLVLSTATTSGKTWVCLFRYKHQVQEHLIYSLNCLDESSTRSRMSWMRRHILRKMSKFRRLQKWVRVIMNVFRELQRAIFTTRAWTKFEKFNIEEHIKYTHWKP